MPAQDRTNFRAPESTRPQFPDILAADYMFTALDTARNSHDARAIETNKRAIAEFCVSTCDLAAALDKLYASLVLAC
jgi:hypothetical protein